MRPDYARQATRRPVPDGAGRRVYLVFTPLALTVIGYVAFGQWPQGAGSAGAYDLRAVLFAVTYTAVAVYAVLFFGPGIFEAVLWRGATVALWIGVLSCAVSRLTGHLLLVNPGNGGLRMVGTLTEPSDWAPILALVLLLALRRRSWLYVLLALAGELLADSPTCLLVLAVTVPLYFALAGTWRHRVPLLLALAVLIPAGTAFVHHADTAAWLASTNSAEVTAGRLVSGIRNAETGGQQGTNTRYANTTVVLADARDGGWMLTGAGPAADATYFPAEYPRALGATVSANAIWISVLFDLGAVAAVILGLLMLTAVWRMRRFPAMTAILLPFFVASLVNSSVPDYSFVALGIMLFAFGWHREAAPGLGTAREYG